MHSRCHGDPVSVLVIEIDVGAGTLRLRATSSCGATDSSRGSEKSAALFQQGAGLQQRFTRWDPKSVSRLCRE